MFEQDVHFLEQHTDVVVLSRGLAEVAVCPEMQGRVMTSTAGGPNGLSYGWINRDFIASGENNLHMNPFGGEDRVWLGPEGGQFSLFFKNGDPFDLDHWFTPGALNEDVYPVIEQSRERVVFEKDMILKNYSDTEFRIRLNREVLLLDISSVTGDLGVNIDPAVQTVAYESVNTITNTGEVDWTRETGLVSVWILGMFNPSPATTVVLPFVPGPEAELGPIVNDAYFGKVPEDRLVIREDVLFFRCDGEYRSKIGLSATRCRPIMGSWDAENGVLTLVSYTRPEGAMEYVNSMWELQEEPFAGDVVNSYNDGPPAPGEKPMGPFYELESSSPAAALAPGESLSHVHRTIHLKGAREALDAVARKALGVSIDEIEKVF